MLLTLRAQAGHVFSAGAEHYRRAAEAGHRSGQARWGLALLHGVGIEPNPCQGESWLRRAALAGDPDAALAVGSLRADGDRRSANPMEAAVWFRPAADAGSASAARALGQLRLAEAADRSPPRAPAAPAAEALTETAMVSSLDPACARGSGPNSRRCCDLDSACAATPEAVGRIGRLVGGAAEAWRSSTRLTSFVTVDTAVAHLAAAMGRAVWILLPYSPDWRQLLDRSDSPWYPTARLFRQSHPGDWTGVIRQVRGALRAG